MDKIVFKLVESFPCIVFEGDKQTCVYIQTERGHVPVIIYQPIQNLLGVNHEGWHQLALFTGAEGS